MRNLKRAISLALASVMLMSMTVIGAGALGFKDADDITDVTAATVLEALEIMIGDDAGNFNPDNVVTRAEMATILCRVVFGTDYEADGYVGITTFTDVAGHWGEAEIGMAYANGWINGKSAESFDPNATVQAYEAYVMLQRALGYYDAADSTSYSLGTYALTLASKTGMSSGISTGAYTGLTRDKVATAVYNTLFNCAKVAYSSWTGIYYMCDIEATPSITNPSVAIGFGDQGTFAADVHKVTIGTEYDVMGRPVDAVYVDGGDALATSPIAADKVFLAGAEKGDIDDAGDVDMTPENTYRSGANPEKLNATFGMSSEPTDSSELAAGFVVEVFNFVDENDADATRYIVYSYRADEIEDIEYDDDNDVTIFEMDNMDFYMDGDLTDVYAEGDFVIYTAGKYEIDTDLGDLYIDEIDFAEVLEGEITRTPSTVTYYYIDGTKYTLGYAGRSDMAGHTTDDVIAFVVDVNGYVIYTEVVSETVTAYDYLYVLDVAVTGTFSSTLQAEVLFADGSTEVITISEIDGKDLSELTATGGALKDVKIELSSTEATGYFNHVYTNLVFSYSEDDGEYELKSVKVTGDDDVRSATNKADVYVTEGYTTVRDGDNKKTSFNSILSLYFTDETIFVDADEAEVFVGYENIPGWNDTFAVNELIAVYEGQDILVLFILDAVQADSTSVGTYVYVDSADYEQISIDGTAYYEYSKIYADGVKTTLTSKDKTVFNGLGGYIVELTVDDDGYVTDASALKGGESYNKDNDTFVLDVQVKTVGNSYIAGVEDVRFSYNSDTVFVYIDEDGDVSKGSKSDIVTYTADKDHTLIHVIADEDYAMIVFIEMIEDGDIENSNVNNVAKT